jgi:hypothetical protein
MALRHRARSSLLTAYNNLRECKKITKNGNKTRNSLKNVHRCLEDDC